MSVNHTRAVTFVRNAKIVRDNTDMNRDPRAIPDQRFDGMFQSDQEREMAVKAVRLLVADYSRSQWGKAMTSVPETFGEIREAVGYEGPSLTWLGREETYADDFDNFGSA